jgi:hypothetical protein
MSEPMPEPTVEEVIELAETLETLVLLGDDQTAELQLWRFIQKAPGPVRGVWREMVYEACCGTWTRGPAWGGIIKMFSDIVLMRMLLQVEGLAERLSSCYLHDYSKFMRNRPESRFSIRSETWERWYDQGVVPDEISLGEIGGTMYVLRREPGIPDLP